MSGQWACELDCCCPAYSLPKAKCTRSRHVCKRKKLRNLCIKEILSGTSEEPSSFDCKHFHNLTLHKMRARQKILEVFSSIFDHNHSVAPHSCHILRLCQNPTNNTSNQVLEMVISAAMSLLRFSPLPKLFFSSAICVSFPPAHLMHLDSTVKVVGPLECLFQGAQP